MAVDRSTVDGLLKFVYKSGNRVESLFNKQANTWKEISKSPKKPDGKGYQESINLQGNEAGQGYINENQALYQPANQVPQTMTVQPKIFTHQIQLSGLSMSIAQGGEASFADNVTFQMDNGIEDAGKEQNSALFRDGTGARVLVNGAVAGAATFNVDGGVVTHLRRGMPIDFFEAGVKNNAFSGVTVVDILPGNGPNGEDQVVVSANITVADNAVIYRSLVNDNPPADGKEIAGFPRATDNGSVSATYFGINRVTFPAFKGITIDAGLTNLSDDILQKAIGRIRVEGNGPKPNKLIANPNGQFRGYLQVLTPLKRFTDGGKMDSGYTSVPTWNGMEWIEDADCGFDEVYMINSERFFRYESRPLSVDDEDGRVLKHRDGFDGYYAIIKGYLNAATNTPNSHARIRNLFRPPY